MIANERQINFFKNVLSGMTFGGFFCTVTAFAELAMFNELTTSDKWIDIYMGGFFSIIGFMLLYRSHARYEGKEEEEEIDLPAPAN